jgi:hypothetical protein
VFTRVAALTDRIVIDMADATWRAIEITRTGWRVIDEPPVRFRRVVSVKWWKSSRVAIRRVM